MPAHPCETPWVISLHCENWLYTLYCFLSFNQLLTLLRTCLIWPTLRAVSLLLFALKSLMDVTENCIYWIFPSKSFNKLTRHDCFKRKEQNFFFPSVTNGHVPKIFIMSSINLSRTDIKLPYIIERCKNTQRLIYMEIQKPQVGDTQKASPAQKNHD